MVMKNNCITEFFQYFLESRIALKLKTPVKNFDYVKWYMSRVAQRQRAVP